MAIRIAINGFGRIGRSVFRLSTLDPEVQVVKINDLSPAATLAHLLKYDSVHGTFAGEVEVDGNDLLVDGRKIICSQKQGPQEMDWSDVGADVVMECTGKFRDRASNQAHLDHGAKKVIVSAPGKESDLTLVMGVNQKDYRPEHKIISNASCTTNCLAPLALVLDRALTLVKGFMTTVHSYTNDQRILCGAHKDLRRARAGGLNQIPTTTGAAKALGLVIPHLKGKVDGMSIRVPTPNVSLVDFVIETKETTSIQAVNELFKQAAKNELKGILDYSDEPLVSSDYNGSKFSSVVDGLSTNVIGGNLVKVLAWYDNETGFSQRMIDLAKYILK